MALGLDKQLVNQIHNSSLLPQTCPQAPFVRASGLKPFIDFLESVGAPVDGLLQRARLPADLLGESETPLPMAACYRFVELAARSEGISDLGVVVAQRGSTFDLGAFGAALARSSTVREYLHTGIRMIGTQNGQVRFWLTPEHDELRVHQSLVGPPGLGRSVADVHTLMSTIGMLQRFIGAGWQPGEVALAAGAEQQLLQGAVFGDASIVTGQDHSSFTMSQSLLNAPLPYSRSLQPSENQAAGGQPVAIDFVSGINALIASLVLDGRPGISNAAEAMGLNPRTLQRRLGDAGVTFSELVVACRYRLASEWLRKSDVPVTEIAHSLGYTDGSNFARAFRRQAGMPPAAYRARYASLKAT